MEYISSIFSWIYSPVFKAQILRFKPFDFFLVFAHISEKLRASLMSETEPMQH
jgi:hypothetical protein